MYIVVLSYMIIKVYIVVLFSNSCTIFYILVFLTCVKKKMKVREMIVNIVD